jgi:hypothetical protein
MILITWVRVRLRELFTTDAAVIGMTTATHPGKKAKREGNYHRRGYKRKYLHEHSCLRFR